MKVILLLLNVVVVCLAAAQRNFNTNTDNNYDNQYPNNQNPLNNQYPQNQYPLNNQNTQNNQYPQNQSGSGFIGGSDRNNPCSASPQWPISDSYGQSFNVYMNKEKSRFPNYRDLDYKQMDIFTAIDDHMTSIGMSNNDKANAWCPYGIIIEMFSHDRQLNQQKVRELINSMGSDNLYKGSFLQSIAPCALQMARLPGQCDLRAFYECMSNRCRQDPTLGGNQGGLNDPRYSNNNNNNYNNNDFNNNSNRDGTYNDPRYPNNNANNYNTNNRGGVETQRFK